MSDWYRPADAPPDAKTRQSSPRVQGYADPRRVLRRLATVLGAGPGEASMVGGPAGWWVEVTPLDRSRQVTRYPPAPDVYPWDTDEHATLAGVTA